MFDFHDSKLMAQSLKRALAAQSIAVTHSQSLELIAQAFGQPNWNILSAKIGAEQGPSNPAPAIEDGALECAFCSLSGLFYKDIAAGGKNGVICQRCVGGLSAIFLDRRLSKSLENAKGRDAHDEAKATAIGALRGCENADLMVLRNSHMGNLDKLSQLLEKSPSEKGAPTRWKPEDLANQFGIIYNKEIGLSQNDIDIKRSELEQRQVRIRERLGFVNDILKERKVHS